MVSRRETEGEGERIARREKEIKKVRRSDIKRQIDCLLVVCCKPLMLVNLCTAVVSLFTFLSKPSAKKSDNHS